jgi:hypothetical protein
MTERDRERQARHRLAVLRHAEEVSADVAATRRFYGISRNCFCKWLLPLRPLSKHFITSES